MSSHRQHIQTLLSLTGDLARAKKSAKAAYDSIVSASEELGNAEHSLRTQIEPRPDFETIGVYSFRSAVAELRKALEILDKNQPTIEEIGRQAGANPERRSRTP